MLSNYQISPKVIVGTSCIALLLVGLLWKRNGNKKNTSNNSLHEDDKPPIMWRRVGEVSGLMLYPLKSGRGISLNKAECALLGLADVENPHLLLHDREFIVYDVVKKTAVSGLINPRIVLMETTPKDKKTVRFSFPGQVDFLLKIPVDTRKVVLLNRWWGEQVSAVDCGEEAAHWLSQTLLNKSSGLRLGFFSQPTVPMRTVQNGWSAFAKVYRKLRSEYLGAYSYMASYLIITEESVKDVNSRLRKSVTEHHYRANIVVRGSPAYSEDSWDWLRIGQSVLLRGFKPCTRCAVIAIDPDTGKLDPNLEPLKTLKQ